MIDDPDERMEIYRIMCGNKVLGIYSAPNRYVAMEALLSDMARGKLPLEVSNVLRKIFWSCQMAEIIRNKDIRVEELRARDLSRGYHLIWTAADGEKTIKSRLYSSMREAEEGVPSFFHELLGMAQDDEMKKNFLNGSISLSAKIVDDLYKLTKK